MNGTLFIYCRSLLSFGENHDVDGVFLPEGWNIFRSGEKENERELVLVDLQDIAAFKTLPDDALGVVLLPDINIEVPYICLD